MGGRGNGAAGLAGRFVAPSLSRASTSTSTLHRRSPSTAAAEWSLAGLARWPRWLASLVGLFVCQPGSCTHSPLDPWFAGERAKDEEGLLQG